MIDIKCNDIYPNYYDQYCHYGFYDWNIKRNKSVEIGLREEEQKEEKQLVFKENENTKMKLTKDATKHSNEKTSNYVTTYTIPWQFQNLPLNDNANDKTDKTDKTDNNVNAKYKIIPQGMSFRGNGENNRILISGNQCISFHTNDFQKNENKNKNKNKKSFVACVQKIGLRQKLQINTTQEITSIPVYESLLQEPTEAQYNFMERMCGKECNGLQFMQHFDYFKNIETQEEKEREEKEREEIEREEKEREEKERRKNPLNSGNNKRKNNYHFNSQEKRGRKPKKINHTENVSISGGVLLLYCLLSYLLSNGQADLLQTLGFVYAIPALVGGLALKYAELPPVPLTQIGAAAQELEALRELKATKIQKKILSDATRYTYGDVRAARSPPRHALAR